jgi:hypothetical protein
MTATPTPSAEKRIQELAEKHGGSLTPEIVLNDAKRAKSPLHPFFIWDDSEAAQKYRLYQASYLIRKIKVEYEVSENKTVRVRAYHNVRPDESDEVSRAGVYVGIETAMTSYKDQLLAQCRRDMQAFRTKYAALNEVSHIIEAMNIELQ